MPDLWCVRRPWTTGELAAKVADGLGIGITDEDGPINTLLSTRLHDVADFREWTEICRMANVPPQPPPRFPATVVWFTDANRGSPIKTMHYLFVFDDGTVAEVD